jgi:hypothetical protein
MVLAYTTGERTSTSGARIGFLKTTTQPLHDPIREVRLQATAALPEAVPGDIRLKSAAAPHVPVFHPNFNTPTMVSALCENVRFDKYATAHLCPTR